MNRKYLPSSLVVLVIGVGMILYPQNIEKHIAPELVTVWEDSVIAEERLIGHLFQFSTWSQAVEDVTTSYIEVWSDDPVTFSATFTLIEDNTPTLIINITENPAQFYIPSEDTVQIQVTGNIIEDQETTVNAGLYRLRPLPPEYVTWYPYRFSGYGMAAVGGIASIVFYLRKEANPISG